MLNKERWKGSRFFFFFFFLFVVSLFVLFGFPFFFFFFNPQIQEELYGVSKEAKDFQGQFLSSLVLSLFSLSLSLSLSHLPLEQQKTLQDELRIVSKERYRLDDAAHAVKIFASEAEEEFSRRKGQDNS